MPGPKLLVVDDEPALGGFAAHVGRRSGFDAKIVLDADAFQQAYERSAPDIVIIDLGMPKGGGDCILRFLASKQCQAPVLIISGFDPQRVDQSRRLGERLGLAMLPPLLKPVRIADLQKVLEDVKARLVAAREDAGGQRRRVYG